MPDPEPGLSRLCPSCGRHVPRSVTTCRCGADIPAVVDDAADATAPRPGGFSPANLTAAAVLIAAVGAAGYWSLSRPPAADLTTRVVRPATLEGGLSGPPAPAAGQDPSPERRAWEAELAKTGKPAIEATAALPETVAAPAAAASLEDVVDRVMPAVVLVETSSGRGSGFFVRPDTVITNVHVVKDDGFVKLRQMDGTTVSARVDLKSAAFDIAILKVMAPAPGQVVIPMGSTDTLRPSITPAPSSKVGWPGRRRHPWP